MAEPFNYKTAAAELLASQSETSGPKLSTYEQCQAYAALLNKIKPSTVARAFGISRIAVSQLHNCLTNRRYRYVRDELRLIGEDNFLAKYYTEDLHTRVAEAKYAQDKDRQTRLYGGPNPKAHFKSFKTIGAFECDSNHWRVDWLHQAPKPGWYFSHCQADGSKPEDDWSWHGMETNTDGGEFRPYRTSTIAWRNVFTYCNKEIPR